MKKYLFIIFALTTFASFGQSNLLLFFDDDKEAPSVPTSPSAVGTPEVVTASWVDPTALDLKWIIVYRDVTTNPTTAIDTVLKGVGSYTDTPLVAGTEYFYRFRAQDYSGNLSAYTSTVSDTAKAIQYAGDYDGSTDYLSLATPPLQMMGKYSLQETFSDGDYTTGNAWTVSSGAYAVTDTVAMYSGLTYALRCATAGIISIPNNWAYGYVAFDWRKGGSTNINYVYLNSKSSNTSTNGYALYTSATSRQTLSIVNSGVHNTLFYSGASYVNNFVSYRDSIVRNTNGSFSVYIKGGTFGDTYTLVSTTGGSGTNPVTDNTYTQSNYFVLDLDAGDMIANIVCEYGMGSMDLNGHELTKYPTYNASFEVGDEVITNGSFGSNITDWTAGGSTAKWYNTDWNAVSRTNAILDSATLTDQSYLIATYGTTSGVRYKLTYTYYIPATNTTCVAVKTRYIGGSNPYGTIQTVVGTWTTASEYVTPSTNYTQIRFYQFDAGGAYNTSAGDKIYIDDVSIKPVPYWEGSGTMSVDTTTEQKQSGSGGAKFVQSLGSDLALSHGDFTDAADTLWWTDGSDAWIMTGGVASASGTSSHLRGAIGGLANNKYMIEFDATITSGSLLWQIGGSHSESAHSVTSGHNIGYCNTSGSGDIYFIPSSFVGTLDNIVIYKSSGDTTTNYAKLDHSYYNTLVAGEKTTLEYWAQEDGSNGSNLIPDSASTFSTYPGGGITYWTAVRGTRAWSTADSSLLWTYDGSSSSPRGISKSGNLTVGKLYKLTFRAKADSNRNYTLSFLGDITSGGYGAVTPNLTTAWQNYQKYFTATATSFYLGSASTSGMTLDDSVMIDNIVLQEITKTTHTVSVGGKVLGTTDTLSCIPGVFEKVVFNFLNDATTVNGDIKIYKNQASIGYMDGNSITQAKDLMVNVWVKTSNVGSNLPIIYYRGISGAFWQVLRSSSNYYRADLNDGVTNVTLNTASTYTSDIYVFVSFLISRTTNGLVYINGALSNTGNFTTIGKVTNNYPLNIGGYSTIYFTGQIGGIQITTFADISTVNYTPAQIYSLSKYNGQYFPRTYTGGTEVLYMKMDDATDESAYGHVFTNNGTVTFGTVTY
jgi:hypothetical protein